MYKINTERSCKLYHDKGAELDLFLFAQFVTSENPTKKSCQISAFESFAGMQINIFFPTFDQGS
jgi:hypothetical protein